MAGRNEKMQGSVFREIDSLLQRGEYWKVDEMMSKLDIAGTSTPTLLIYLTATLHAWSFYTKVKEDFINNRGYSEKNIEAVLRGLE
ncbi:hypothetical protein J4477_03490 [Candidatus Pacearchaeota archaeon]|nr:hypothetical protein [Candidatus Pacearchaeota archaeon]